MVDEDKTHKETFIEEIHERLPKRWPRLLGFLIAALLIAFVLVYGGRTIYRNHHKPVVKIPATSTTRPVFKEPSGSGSGSSNSNQTTGGQALGSSQLPNNGPGQVIGLFVGASLAAASLHYVIRLRKVA